ncbi:hypothetical protein [Paenibacillus rigui]|uniref:Uncharacterized protein n=1 Tax=Paenibacillus rigui TaxID=554312 RepID=A0A229US65_9BACL|nr:hypothetical protein [Paenibacillus rigui]OXM86376.1 hypothetical protein CF651_10615 [Paenibacillus rigui]
MSNQRVKIVVSGILLWAATIVTAGADGGPGAVQPGSVDDPVITKSYFEQNISKYIADELFKQQNGHGSTGSATPPATNQPNSPTVAVPAVEGSSTLNIIKLEPGQSLYGGAGSEIIVRTGKVIVFSSDDSGLADVTIGKDITAGAPVELNHLLIVPREGRGIKPDPKSKIEIYVMVRGSYMIMNADGTKATS